MAKKEEAKGIVYVSDPSVKVDLSADPNDPRKAEPTPKLPSLNDADQN